MGLDAMIFVFWMLSFKPAFSLSSAKFRLKLKKVGKTTRPFRCDLNQILGSKAMTNLDGILKSTDIILPTKVRIIKAMVFPVVNQMWELDHNDGWEPKNWYFQIVVLEKTLEESLDSSEIKPVNPKGSQSWTFIGRTVAEAQYFGLFLTHWKRPWCWERSKANREGVSRGWDG